MRKRILGTVTDLISNFLYYDRKEDEELGVGEIEDAIKRGDITVEEIISLFESELRDGIEDE